MIASLIPLRNAYAATVVIDDEADPPTVRAVLSIPAGRLEPLENPTERYNARRVVDDDAAHEIAAQIVPLWQAHGVTRALVVRPRYREGINAEHAVQASARIADTVAASCPATIEVRAQTRWHKGGWTLEEAAALPGWPEWATFRVARMAGALALYAVRGRARDAKRDLAVLAQIAGEDAPATVAAPPTQSAAKGPLAADAPPPKRRRAKRPDPTVAAPPVREIPPIAPGARIAGFDPGSAYAGLAIAEAGPLPLRAIHAETFRVGERVLLATPKVSVRADGTSRVTLYRQSITTEHVDAIAAAVVARLLEHGVTHLAIEHVDSVWLSKDKPGTHMSQATAIARSSWLDGAVGQAARAAGIEVVRVSAIAWRSAVAGRSREGFQGDDRVRAALSVGFADWPATADAHARDAGGLCLWLVRPPSKKAQKAARQVVADVAGEPRRAHGVSAVRAARNAAGCTCSRRHILECPLYVPQKYRRRASVLHSPPAADGVSPPQDAVGGR